MMFKERSSGVQTPNLGEMKGMLLTLAPKDGSVEVNFLANFSGT
jgi:hypothetical protein